MFVFYKKLYPFFITSLIVYSFVAIPDQLWVKYNVDVYVLHAANILYLVMGIAVFKYQQIALTNANPNVFIRSIMAGMMIKMFITVIAVLAYVLIAGKGYNTKAVFISLLLYLLYLGVEVSILSKENSRKNAKR